MKNVEGGSKREAQQEYGKGGRLNGKPGQTETKHTLTTAVEDRNRKAAWATQIRLRSTISLVKAE